MILVGLDDTDMPGTPGTNQLARRLIARLPPGWRGLRIVRHQLLDDARIPYTSRNGSASLWLEPPAQAGAAGPRVAASRREAARGPASLLPFLRAEILEFAPPGSDPALCVAGLDDGGRNAGAQDAGAPRVAPAVIAFGRRCQREIVEPAAALRLARAHGLHLESLGGSGGGVIGALAAVALAATGDDGRVVHLEGWPWPDEYDGVRTMAEIRARGIEAIREPGTERPIRAGRIRVDRRLRPALRGGRVVLYVEPGGAASAGRNEGDVVWRALKLP